jgi:hypothetical protein
VELSRLFEHSLSKRDNVMHHMMCVHLTELSLATRALKLMFPNGTSELEFYDIPEGGRVYRVNSESLKGIEQVPDCPPGTHGKIIDGVVMAFTPYSQTALRYICGTLSIDWKVYTWE